MSLSFKIKLLRDDVALGSIPTVEDCLLSPPQIKRGTPIDIVNDVRVNYALRCAIPIPAITGVSCHYGQGHGLITVSDGNVWCFGENGYGQLGDGSYDNQPTPVLVTDGHVFVSARTYWESGWGLDADGQLWVWGHCADYAHGHGSVKPPYSNSTPHYGGGENALDHVYSEVNLGSWHGVGIDTGGRAWGWGVQTGGSFPNIQSECGLGLGYIQEYSYTYVLTPVQEALGKTDWVTGDCGYQFSALIDTNANLYMTGDNGSYQLGLGDDDHRHTFEKVGESTYVKVSCGYFHTAAIRDDGFVYMWGHNDYGQCGQGAVYYVQTPTKIDISNVVDVVCGDFHTFILQGDGTLWVAGYNNDGELGLGDQTNRTSFVEHTAYKYTFVCAGGEEGIGATSDNKVYIWGNWISLNLGDQTTPIELDWPDNPFEA